LSSKGFLLFVDGTFSFASRSRTGMMPFPDIADVRCCLETTKKAPFEKTTPRFRKEEL
jgi:hypothetical protein